MKETTANLYLEAESEEEAGQGDQGTTVFREIKALDLVT